MKKILIVVPHFAPYRDDTFKYIESKGNYQIKFLITEGNVTHTEWNYKNNSFNYKQNAQGLNLGTLGTLYDELKRYLKNYKPDVVILCGNIINVLYVKFLYRKTKVIFCSDQIKNGINSKNILNRFILKFLYNLTDGIWTTGKAGELYFKQYVKNHVKIKQGCYTNDINRIMNSYKKYDNKKERNKLEIPQNAYVFLFVGKLIKSRRIDKILDVSEYYNKNNKMVKFLIVGDGSDSKMVTERMKTVSNIIYIPSISLSDLEKVYAVADAYLYLGWEPYSLALYEAAIIGIPIIANEKIGAMYDCVDDGINGASIKTETIDSVFMACNNAIEKKYNIGAKEKQKEILNKRGIKWAGDQLMELID